MVPDVFGAHIVVYRLATRSIRIGHYFIWERGTVFCDHQGQIWILLTESYQELSQTAGLNIPPHFGIWPRHGWKFDPVRSRPRRLTHILMAIGGLFFGNSVPQVNPGRRDRKSTRLNSSHVAISY